MSEVVLRFSLLEQRGWTQPRVETDTEWITVGLDQDLHAAARLAVLDMIALLGSEYGILAEDAYSLCSVAVDLSVSQLVNGVKGIQARLPKEIFVGVQRRA